MRRDGTLRHRRAARIAIAALAALSGLAATGAQEIPAAPAVDFTTAFEPLPEVRAVPPAPPEHAVDLATFDPPVEAVPPAPEARYHSAGNASYYGRRFAGRKTANGERFNPQALTAAHRTLPFGTKVKVTDPRSGRSVVVRINDRGPFHGNRIIDVSRAAAEQLGFVSRGTARVELALVD